MRTPRYTAALLVIAFVGGVSTANAQERKGFWFEFDIGGASAGISATNFDDSRTGTGIAGFALGWAVNPRVLVGFDMHVAPVDITGPVAGTLGLYNVGARVAYYPWPARAWFVKGTVGGSLVDIDFDEAGSTLNATVGKGLGLGAGIGYDWYLGRGISLTPAVSYWYGHPGEFRLLGQTYFTDWSHNVVDMTVGVSFH